MTGYEMKTVLGSFELIVDTREQATSKLDGRIKDFGCPFTRAILDYGDYAANVTYPNENKLYDTSARVCPKVCIERKLDLDELAVCLTHDRERFVRELERAKKNNAKLYLLVEDGCWDDIISNRYKSWMKPKAFLSSLTAFMARYNLVVVFAQHYNSGLLIKDILYHEMVEMLRKEVEV